jgi:hypothetical protein
MKMPEGAKYVRAPHGLKQNKNSVFAFFAVAEISPPPPSSDPEAIIVV